MVRSRNLKSLASTSCFGCCATVLPIALVHVAQWLLLKTNVPTRRRKEDLSISLVRQLFHQVNAAEIPSLKSNRMPS